MHAGLEVIIGGMYSGKSTGLLNRLTRHKIANRKVFLFKPKIDNRYSDSAVVTHSGQDFPATLVENSQTILKLMDIFRQQVVNEPIVVGIDEAQFLDESLIGVVNSLMPWCNRVIVAGLDTDFLAKPWPTMVPLVMTAEKLTKLNAICVQCGEDANFTQRLIDGSPTTHGDTVLVGGSESYEARCRGCYVGP